MKRLLVSSLLATSVLVGGCGVAKDDVAASVNGHEITISQVDKLAKTTELSQAAAGDPSATPSTTPGSLDGSVARQAVLLYIQRELLARALRTAGGSVTADDRTAAEQRTGSMSAAIKPFASQFFSLNAALIRVVKAGFPDPTQAEITAYFEQHQAEFAQTCIDVIGVQPAGVAAARTALKGGTTFAAYLAAHPDTVQAIAQDGVNVCLDAGDAQNAQVLDLVKSMAIGAVNENESQPGGAVAFIKVTSRTTPTLQSPELVSKISATLKSATSTAVTQAVNKKVLAEQTAAKITLDPRYGTWDPNADVPVVAPLAPRSATTTTTPPIVPAS